MKGFGQSVLGHADVGDPFRVYIRRGGVGWHIGRSTKRIHHRRPDAALLRAVLFRDAAARDSLPSAGAIQSIYRPFDSRDVRVSCLRVVVIEAERGACRSRRPVITSAVAVERLQRGILGEDVSFDDGRTSEQGLFAGDKTFGVDGLPDRKKTIDVGMV